MDQLTSMSMFVKVVEKGGFAAAAAGSGMSATMVGNHIRALEDRLGTRLLHRTTRRQSLTEIGRAYYDECVSILARVEAAETNAREMRSHPRGQLRITAPLSYGSQLVVPILADYMERYPDVEIDLVLNDRVIDITEESFDVAIRVGPVVDGLVARALAPSPRIICASPDYIARHGRPKTPADLVHHRCLAFSYYDGPDYVWQLPGDIQDAYVHINSRISINSWHGLRMAAICGMGIIMQPVLSLREDIAAGLLVELLEDFPKPVRPVHLIYHPDRLMTPKLKSFVEFTLERLG